MLLIASCSKKNSSEIAKAPYVSFTFADNKRPSGLADTLNDGRFFAVVGGNEANNDTTHGYVFSAGPVDFEIPALTSGTFTYEAFSASWPRPLGLDQWTNWDGTFLDPANISIIINIGRYSNRTADGTFSLTMSNGIAYVVITKGIFFNLPVD